MRLRRVNMDSSWQLQWGDRSILIDPWLIGSEVDWFPWFNEQWHTTECVEINQLGQMDAILVSQSYSDHCHIPTLQELNAAIPILASAKAAKRIMKNFSDREVYVLPDLVKQGWMKWEDLELCSLHPGNRLDPVYYGIGIKKTQEVSLYFSHGFELSMPQLEALQDYKVKLLACSFSEIKLPSLLGGNVNPGLPNARKLVDQLNPEIVVNTHDEQKTAKGIVMKMAKSFYPDLSKVQFDGNTRYMHAKDYNWISI